MKKETKTFPLENLISIEIDRENGVALANYEEKKPLYTNSYGTEFFEGDDHFYVNRNNGSVFGPNEVSLDTSFKQDEYYSESMTKDECEKWKKDLINKMSR